MHCLDCTTEGRSNTAIGVCTTCGAAVCADCARIGRRTTRHDAGFASADLSLTETRTVACPPCATALGTHHAGRYRFTAPVQRVLQPR